MKRILADILYGLIWLLSLLPLRLLYLVSDIIWLAMFLCPPLRYRRRVVWKNLTASFPKMSEKELHKIERRFYLQFLDQIMESLKSASMGKKWISRHMRFEGLEYISDNFAQGRSMVMYLGHTGNWEWISSMPIYIDPSVCCCQVYHPLENAVMDRICLRLRCSYGAATIPMKQIYRKLLELKHAGQPFIVGMIADQVPLWWDIHYWTRFLERKTPVLTGSEQIARKLDLGVCYCHISRTRRGRYTASIVPMFQNTRDLDEFAVTEKYIRLLEDNIREDPSLWLWTHNRWKRNWEGYQRWLKTRLKSTKRDAEKE